MLNKEVIVVGYSGHGYVVTEAARLNRFNVCYYTEVKPVQQNPFDLEYLGFEGDDNFEGWSKEAYFILGIGDNKIRFKAAKLIESHGKSLLNVLHPSISLSRKVSIGSGNFFAKNVSIPLLVAIGDFCIFNNSCIIEHECQVGNAVHVAPGAVLLGNVKVGDFSFIGANAVVRQGVTIGKNVTVGAGSVVLNDVADDLVIVGNPAREI